MALDPDPSHPTGQALCVKGKAAPEVVRHTERLLHPRKRTRPKGAGDPGWQRITWDEALDTVAERLLDLARDHGPESVVFSVELGLPGYPPFGLGSANLNLVLRQRPSDPISGSSPPRAAVCEIAPLAAAGVATQPDPA